MYTVTQDLQLSQPIVALMAQFFLAALERPSSLRGLLSPEEHLQLTQLMAEQPKLVIANVLRIRISVNPYDNYTVPVARIGSDIEWLYTYGSNSEYGVCTVYGEGKKKFAVEAMLGFPVQHAEGPAPSPIEGCYWIEVSPNQIGELIKEGQTVGQRLLDMCPVLFTLYKKKLSEAESQSIEVEVDIPLDDLGVPQLGNVRFSMQTLLRTTPWARRINLTEDADLDPILRGLAATIPPSA